MLGASDMAATDRKYPASLPIQRDYFSRGVQSLEFIFLLWFCPTRSRYALKINGRVERNIGILNSKFNLAQTSFLYIPVFFCLWGE